MAIQRNPFPRIFALTIALVCASTLHAAPPDLTAPGAIAALKTDPNATPVYGLTYNLGPTGMRGWIHLTRASGATHGEDGTMTDEARQILVTVASAPANTALAVDDLILGVDWGSGTGPIPLFTSDARKAFGAAITEAEKSENGGILRVKRWRAGVTTDVSINLAVMGTYSASAPYNCPKSTAILASARNRLVSQLIANPNFLTSDWKGAISGLALLAGVAPGDPDYDTVQSRLQTYAHAVAAMEPGDNLSMWSWAYLGLFLSEYYLATDDAAVLPGIQQFSLTLAQSQSIFGTFGHAPAMLRPDGSGRMSVIGYGPVNSVGIPANLAIVMGRKALAAASQTVDPQIDTAIQRSSDYFAWYTNKGSIPYGEHHPWMGGHASNGKDQMAAVFFSQLENRTAETEFFTRMSIAGFPGRESGHTGQGFSYLWEGMATHVGGELAVSEYFKPIRWHLDLTRRTDGSFAYDGGEGYDAGKTSDGTYLGDTGYHGLNPTACFLLTYSLPLKRLHITGKNANPAHELDSAKVTNAIAAATYKFDRTSRTSTQLIADLAEFDPIVRDLAAKELATRTLSPGEGSTLRTMLSASNTNERMGACQTLGLLKDSTAMNMITERLDKNVEADPWVRAFAANALVSYGTAANSQVNTMLTRFVENAEDPDTIVWSDPLQASNGMLSFALFKSMPGTNDFDFGATVINTAKNTLYPAVSTGFKQPDSAVRQGTAVFAFSRMPVADVQAMPNDFINLILSETQCDRMWSYEGRRQGIRTLSKFKFFETMPLGLSLLDVPTGFEWGSHDCIEQTLTEIATFGESARWTLPTLRSYLNTWPPGSATHSALVHAINTIEAATTTPTIIHLKAAANNQVVTTSAGSAKAITLTGSSSRDASVSFEILTQPSHGNLTGTPPNLTYTPNPGYTGPDQFTFHTTDTLTTSEPATVGIVVGTSGNGLKGEYFDNPDFTNLVLTRTDAQVNFDWGTGSPHASINADTFSVRWSGLLQVPETCAYTFSALSNDGVRLYINGALVINNFVDQNAKWTDSAPIQLTQGQMVEIQMEYYENTGSAAAKLKWTGPSAAGTTGAIIPQSYLFDGSGFSDRTPYAHAQTVSTELNTAKPITLSGSGGTLTYTVLTQPANGTLTGIAPYLTYTPTTGFSGTDSFTFLVNNGSANSFPATVSISVAAGPTVTYTWASAVSANMSTAARWVDGVAPPSAGLANANLNFAPTGSYTATHDLNSGFKLNQLHFSGAVTIAGTNSLSFSANGGTLPRLNQNSTNAVNLNTPVELAATTTFEGTLGGSVTLGGLVSGNGGLVKSSLGTLQINNVNNTYTGGTVLDYGTVTFPAGNGSATPHFGTGPVTVNPNATLHVNRTSLSNAITLNGCTISGGNSFASFLSGPVTLNGIVTISLGNTGGLEIPGNVSGPGGITTIGTSQWMMNGTNSYTGPTTIQAGTLRYAAAAAVAPGALIIANGGKANLNYSGNRVVASLTLGGIAMPPGSYGGSSSSATFKNDGYFTSTSVGTITVLPPTTTTLALTSGSSPANPGTSLTFTATVSGNSPTGSVQFFSGTTLLGSNTLNGSFHAAFSTSQLAIGAHTITAHYLGNATNTSSTSSPVLVEISGIPAAAPTGLNATPASPNIVLNWTASPGATAYYVKRSTTNGGPYTVVAMVSGTSWQDNTPLEGVTYYYVVSALNAAGESTNSDQASALVGSPSATTTTLSATPVATSVYGSSVTFTATVTAVSGTPTGTVTFRSGANIIGTGNLSSGSASLVISTLPAATHSITANYEAGGSHDPSISSVLSYQVTPKPLTLTGVTASNKTYDGTTAATLSGGTLSGVVGGDTVTLIPGIGTFANANVGTWTVTAASYSLGGTHAANYTLTAQPTVANATITARPIHITGTKTYDGTTAAPNSILTIANNVDGANLALTGTATLNEKGAGQQTLLPAGGGVLARIQSTTAATSGSSNTLGVTLASNPANGNTLIAVISTRGTSANRISGITGGGVAWSRVSQATNTNGSTTEIWAGSNVSSGGTAITINAAASLRLAAVVMEYSGLLVPTPFDVAANNTGNSSSPSTGTTDTTSQANQLWIGGIGTASSSPTLGSITNSFATIAEIATSGGGNATTQTKTFALERIVTTAGTATTGGTLSASVQWSGTIATFHAAAAGSSLSLTGSAAGNYTLTGMTSSITVNPKPLTVSGLSASNKTYDGTTAASVAGTPALLSAQAPGSGTTEDGKPYTGDTITLGGAPTGGSFASKHVGTNKPVTGVTGLTLDGAQAANYSLVPLGTLTANITQRALIVAAVTETKTYDGTTIAFNTPTLTPALAPGDTASSLSQTYQSKSVGNSNITLVPSITIDDGNGGNNYAVTLTNVTTGTITPKPITVAAVNASKTYDGTTTAAGTPTITPPLASGDTTSALFQTFETPTAGTNNKVIIPSITINDGDNGNNYDVTLANFTTGTIHKAAATVTLGNLSHTHDGTPKSATVTTDPAGLAYTVTYNGSTTAPTDGGTYAVVATITDPNYAGSASGDLVISYLITYHGNGNTSGTAPASQTKLQGVDLTVAINSGSLSKTGYTFVGWNTVADGTGTDYTMGQIYSENASLTLYAKWMTGSYLTWDANGSSANQTDGGGTWFGSNLWWNGTTNQDWTSGASATFGNDSAGGAVTLASPTTAESINFNAFTGTYSLGTSGQTLTLINGITLNPDGRAVTFISPIAMSAPQTWLNNSSDGAIQMLFNSTVNNGGHHLTIGGNAIAPTRTTGNVRIVGAVSGDGGLTKTGNGVLWLQAAPTYLGPTHIEGGTIRFQITGAANLPVGNIAINGGVMEAYWGETYSRSLGTAAGEIRIPGGVSGFSQHGGATLNVKLGNTDTPIQWGSTHFNPTKLILQESSGASGAHTVFQNALDLNGIDRTVEVRGNAAINARASISGIISNSSGIAGLIKSGNGLLILTTNNTYNGNTTVEAGTLRINVANTHNDTSTVSIATDATLHLGFTGTDTVDKLIVDGTQLAAGVYKAPGSVATGTELAQLAGTGTITVTSNPATSYTVSYHANGATSGTPPVSQSKTHGVDLTLAANSGNLALTGYLFSGWNTLADGSGTDYAAEGTYTPNASVTLYAKWQTHFERWVADNGGDQVTFTGDSNIDGVADGLAWLLGADSPTENAASLLPVPQQSNGAISVSFHCLTPAARGTAILRLQYSATLQAESWTTVEIPADSGSVDGVAFDIIPVPETNLQEIQATVPSDAANGGGKIFVRLTADITTP